MANNGDYDYHTTEPAGNTSPYGSGDPYYNKSSGYIASGPSSRPKRNWLKFGVPIAILVIVGAVVGGVLGSRSSKKNNSTSSGGSNGGNGGGGSDGGTKNGLGRFPTSTDPFYGMPIYPSSVSLAPCFSQCMREHYHACPFCLPALPFSIGWLTYFLLLSTIRQTPHSTASPRSPRMLRTLGPATPSIPAPRPPPPCAQTDLESSLPDTSGMPSPISLPTNRTSQLGTTLFLPTQPTIIVFLLSSTTWMAPAVSLTTLERSR